MHLREFAYSYTAGACLCYIKLHPLDYGFAVEFQINSFEFLLYVFCVTTKPIAPRARRDFWSVFDAH